MGNPSCVINWSILELLNLRFAPKIWGGGESENIIGENRNLINKMAVTVSKL